MWNFLFPSFYQETDRADLRALFEWFGEIIDIEIKNQGAETAYAFVQYADIQSVVAALDKMDGQRIGQNKIKVKSASWLTDSPTLITHLWSICIL